MKIYNDMITTRNMVLAVLLAISGALSSRAAVLLNDNFDSGTNGASLTSPWSITGTGSVTYSNTTSVSSPLSAHLVNTAASATASNLLLARSLSSAFDISSGQKLSMSFDVNFSQTNFQGTFQLLGATGLNVLSINFLGDGRVSATNGASTSFINPVAPSYVANTWYNVSVLLDSSTNTYSFTLVNDATSVTVGTLTSLAVANAVNITTFRGFESSKSSANAGFYLDNVAITTAVPEPSAFCLTILGLGGLGFICRARTRLRA